MIPTIPVCSVELNWIEGARVYVQARVARPWLGWSWEREQVRVEANVQFALRNASNACPGHMGIHGGRVTKTAWDKRLYFHIAINFFSVSSSLFCVVSPSFSRRFILLIQCIWFSSPWRRFELVKSYETPANSRSQFHGQLGFSGKGQSSRAKRQAKGKFPSPRKKNNNRGARRENSFSVKARERMWRQESELLF